MKEEIKSNLDNPHELEILFRENPSLFKTEFNGFYPELSEHPMAAFWHERLNFDSPEISFGSGRELFFVIVASLLAGVIARLPAILNIAAESFYQRNIGFIVFPILSAYFIWKNKLMIRQIVLTGLVFFAALIFINLLPQDKSDTTILSCIHLAIFLWFIFGVSFLGNDLKSNLHRLNFLRYNGDFVVMTTLILIAGMIMTGVTIGLFSLIGLEIKNFYMENIAIVGLAAAPIVGNYLIQRNPQLVSKVSPVIAKIFTPLVTITLLVYLAAILYSGKDPYNDRGFLIIFNLLLIGVMALILFSVAETSTLHSNQNNKVILFALAVLTIIVNGIALSAIVFRIAEWGITPNRVAVLGANLLVLANLVLVTIQLFKALKTKNEMKEVENAIAGFLPYYGFWIIFVTFIFPFLFGFN